MALASHGVEQCHHHCHQTKPESGQCHSGQGDTPDTPGSPGDCNCEHQGSSAAITSAGGSSLNLAPILQISTFDFPEPGFSVAAIDDHLHFDPRNTTGPPVLQGASAQTFFCHFTL